MLDTDTTSVYVITFNYFHLSIYY